MKLAAFCLTMLLVNAGAEQTLAHKIVLTDPNAKCIDGSQAVMYVSPGTNKNAFYIYHQGGGWCQTVEECEQRSSTALGSSKTYPATKNLLTTQTHVFMKRSKELNPLMSDWTFVWLPYCDGGSFTGKNVTTNFLGKKLHFQGTAIRESVIAQLNGAYGLGTAKDVVIGGCSAGGAAVYMHADWYAQQVPSAKVRGMPDSGWFLDGNYARDGKQNYDERMMNMYTMMNSTSGLATTCTSSIGYKCLFAPHAIAYIQTPIFALNSKFDASMASGTYGDKNQYKYSCTSYTARPCDAASVNQFGAFITSSMKSLMVPPHGVFLDSCYRHCSINDANYDIAIAGKKASLAAEQWYNNQSTALFYDQGKPFGCSDCCT
jgi:hypothetical protein